MLIFTAICLYKRPKSHICHQGSPHGCPSRANFFHHPTFNLLLQAPNIEICNGVNINHFILKVSCSVYAERSSTGMKVRCYRNRRSSFTGISQILQYDRCVRYMMCQGKPLNTHERNGTTYGTKHQKVGEPLAKQYIKLTVLRGSYTLSLVYSYMCIS